jgi:hypothetical protein
MTAVRTYTVTWRRHGETEFMTCTRLSMRTALARLMSAVHSNGHIEIHSIVRDSVQEPS